jgi:hypothetical protein
MTSLQLSKNIRFSAFTYRCYAPVIQKTIERTIASSIPFLLPINKFREKMAAIALRIGFKLFIFYRTRTNLEN